MNLVSQNTDLKEAVAYAAASGHVDTIAQLVEQHSIPAEIRSFGHALAVAGEFHDVARLLQPEVH